MYLQYILDSHVACDKAMADVHSVYCDDDTIMFV